MGTPAYMPPEQPEAPWDFAGPASDLFTLRGILFRAMAKRPEDRYAMALELAVDGHRWRDDQPVTAWREPLFARVRRLWVGAQRADPQAQVIAN